MKKLISIVIVISILFIGCADNKFFDGKEYKTYGLIDKDDIKDLCVKYELAWGNIIWSALLLKSLVMPIYFFGFSLWEPVEKIEDCGS